MNLFKKFFKREELHSEINSLTQNESDKQLIKKFSRLNVDRRTKNIIIAGDLGDLKSYPLLKYSIMYDPDLQVKMAALKRIHLFKTHSDTILMLKKLSEHINVKELEPYYSMALSKTGIISLKEFEERISGSAK